MDYRLPLDTSLEGEVVIPNWIAALRYVMRQAQLRGQAKAIQQTVIVDLAQQDDLSQALARVRFHREHKRRVVVTSEHALSWRESRELFRAGAADCVARPQRAEHLWREIEVLYR